MTMDTNRNRRSSKNWLYCKNCGFIGLTDLILHGDICHCLKCDSLIRKWSHFTDKQKAKIEVTK